MSRVALVGGGSRDPRWSQLRADVTGCVYQEMPVRDAGCLGAAMMAGVGAGLFGSLEEAARGMVGSGRAFSPDPERHAAFAAARRAYREAVPATRRVRLTQ